MLPPSTPPRPLGLPVLFEPAPRPKGTRWSKLLVFSLFLAFIILLLPLLLESVLLVVYRAFS